MKRSHAALAVLVAAIWGANFVVIDVGLDSFPPLLFSALRFSLAAIPAVFFVGPPRVAWRWVLIVGLVLGVAKFSLLFIGMKTGMPAGLASLVLQAQVVFTIAFATLFLRERPRRMQLIGMAVAIAGVVLVGVRLGTTAPMLAFLLIIAAAVCWGVANVATRKASPPDMFRFMVWVSTVPPIPLLLLSGLFEGVDRDVTALRTLPPSGIVATVYVAWCATLLGYAAWGFLLRVHGAAAISPYALLIPVFGLATAAVFQHEPITLVTILAAALVVAGIAIGMLRPVRLRGTRSRPLGSMEKADREPVAVDP